ncbi:Yip1 family protein [Sphingosinicella sp.]|uniref:Yip1 family protein n=1 Tax=Sphingosinicella sp. TaxID=1917971 RepID=UPI004037854B
MTLIDRAKNILLTPKTEWGVIDAEPATVQGLYTSYVLILAAIGPIAMLIGQQVFGWGAMGVTIKPPLNYSIGLAVITYVLGLVSVYVMALIIDALAPSFNGTKNQIQAMKVAAYAPTAAWLAGIFQIVPGLAFLGIVGLYSLYLYYLGMPRLMRVPEDKALGYVVVVCVAYVIVFFVVSYIATMMALSFFGAPSLAIGGGRITIG